MLKKVLLGLFLFVLFVVLFHSFIIGIFVKPQAERMISKLLGTEARMSALSVRLWPGNAAVYGFKIKNPEGFSENNLLDIESFSVDFDVLGFVKQASPSSGVKKLIIDQIKIKKLKLFLEKIVHAQGTQCNIEKLIKNLNTQKLHSSSAELNKNNSTEAEFQKNKIEIELKSFQLLDGQVTIHDKTIGAGFDYAVSKININFENIFIPAKPANELVEAVDISANLGNQNAGTLRFQGRSNLMSGINLDGKLFIQDVGLSDFNAFLVDQPFQIFSGNFNLQSDIKILSSQLASQHYLKLNSLKLSNKPGNEKMIMDLPLQTILATLGRLASMDVPFEVNGDLKNPQFKIGTAIRTAITQSIQKVLAGGLTDLKGVAGNLSESALGLATAKPEELAQNAKKIIKELKGESPQALEGGLKKLSGLFAKMKEN